MNAPVGHRLNAQIVVARFLEAATKLQNFLSTEAIHHLLSEIVREFEKAERYYNKFPMALSAALREDRTELEEDEVWQDQLVSYWKNWNPIEDRLRNLSDDLEDYTFDEPGTYYLDHLVGHIQRSQKILDNYVDPLFRYNERLNRKHIAYKTNALKDWAKEAIKWAKVGRDMAEKLLKKRPPSALEWHNLQKTAFKYEPKESKQSKVDRLMRFISKATGIGRGVAEDIADAIIRNRDLARLAVQKHWPMNTEGFVEGPHGALSIGEIRAVV